MRPALVILVGLSSLLATGQSVSNRYSKLSGPEKWWVITHPFKARKALQVSLNVLEVTDSIRKTGLIGFDNAGGHLDAFKHSYWSYSLALEIGERAAVNLGKAHEKGNYKTFKKGKSEDGILPDKASSEMDSFNNQQGITLARNQEKTYTVASIDKVLELLRTGQLKIIAKKNDQYLDCDDFVIDMDKYKGTWENPKCLVNSNIGL